jgi:hypothetical protein
MFGILNISTPAENTGSIDQLSAVCIVPVSITSNRREGVTDTLTLKRNSIRNAGHRWEITCGLYCPEGVSDFYSTMVDNGMTLPFFLRPPMPIKSLGNAKGIYNGFDLSVYNMTSSELAFSKGIGALASSSTSGSTVLNCKVSNANLPNVSVLHGDFVQLTGHTKLYSIKKVYNVSTLNNPNTFAISISPPLVKTACENETIRFGVNVTMPVLADSVASLNYEDGVLEGIRAITFLEDLE